MSSSAAAGTEDAEGGIPAPSLMSVLRRKLDTEHIAYVQISERHLQILFKTTGAAAYPSGISLHARTDDATYASMTAANSLSVPAHCRRQALALLLAINAFASYGVAELDASDGELRVRASHTLWSDRSGEGHAARQSCDRTWSRLLNTSSAMAHIVFTALALLLEGDGAAFLQLSHEDVYALGMKIALGVRSAVDSLDGAPGGEEDGEDGADGGGGEGKVGEGAAEAAAPFSEIDA